MICCVSVPRRRFQGDLRLLLHNKPYKLHICSSSEENLCSINLLMLNVPSRHKPRRPPPPPLSLPHSPGRPLPSEFGELEEK